MNSAVGFTATLGIGEKSMAAAVAAQQRAVAHFRWLKRLIIEVGESKVELWAHNDPDSCVHRLSDDTALVLIGSPNGAISWSRVEDQLSWTDASQDFELPWDGRVVLLKISGDGKHWTMWNDWCGSIPVFHTQIGQGRIASTLEPVVVAAAGYTPDDFFLPGLVSLLINGHYLGDWTLYKGTKVVPPDSVAEWDDDGFSWKRLWTVEPSDERWDRGWDDLADEMHELSRRAIADVLKTQPSWILPLSGGLDSRLIAAVGAEMGVELYAYTYGPSGGDETIYAHQVAKALRLPWQRVELGTDYLVKYTRMWADWFGSALHFHGMYQMPFLRCLNSAPPGPIVQGFLGEALAGLHLPGLISAHGNGDHHGPLTGGWIHWSIEEVKSLLKVPVDGALEQVADEMESQINGTPGAWFQRLMFLDLWNRQRRFVCYQPIMYDYWRGVITPFHNREYARFCLSLPLLALERRRLQAEMFRRYYPKLATIPGTYGALPLTLSRGYIFKRGLAELLPRAFRWGPLREFSPAPNTLDMDCVRASGQAAFWPIYEAWERLAEWFDMSEVTAVQEPAVSGEPRAISKLAALQPLAYRVLNNRTHLREQPAP